MINYKNSILTEFMEIYGVGKSTSLKMCKKIRVSPKKHKESIPILKKRKAFNFLKKTKKLIEFELKDQQLQKFVNLYTIKHLKSFKHKFFLPINGQRNCTNGSTAKKKASQLRPLIYKQLKQIYKRKKKIKN